MRFHVVAAPNYVVTKSWSHDAYCQKVFNFCRMMMDLGHEVILYAAEGSDAPCTNLVVCITRNEMRELIGIESPVDNLLAAYDPSNAYWQLFNGRVIENLVNHQPQDFLCLIAGLAQKPIADALPNMTAVEFGIGYGGVFAPYKVFESYAWMHTVYGARASDPHAADGQFYDTVIPNYYDPEDFPFQAEKEDYYLYIGRLIDRKGWRIVQEVCQRLGKRLIVAGQGDFNGYGEYVGVVGPEERAKLMGGAKAVFVPSLYLEPFGGVHAEAQLCGTPVITTDWGVFSETVIDGLNGYRCRTLQEFIDAANKVQLLDPAKIRSDALKRWSLDVIALQYERYFERLLTLYGDGWYTVA